MRVRLQVPVCKGQRNFINTIRHGRGSAWREKGGMGRGVHIKNTHLLSLPFSLPLFCLYLLLLSLSLSHCSCFSIHHRLSLHHIHRQAYYQ